MGGTYVYNSFRRLVIFLVETKSVALLFLYDIQWKEKKIGGWIKRSRWPLKGSHQMILNNFPKSNTTYTFIQIYSWKYASL